MQCHNNKILIVYSGLNYSPIYLSKKSYFEINNDNALEQVIFAVQQLLTDRVFA